MALARKKIMQVNKLMTDARMEMMLEAFGPKCFVIMSMHMKESHEIRIPPSSAIQSNWSKVLLASRFMQMTLTTKSVTTVEGMERNKILVSSFSFCIHAFIFIVWFFTPWFPYLRRRECRVKFLLWNYSIYFPNLQPIKNIFESREKSFSYCLRFKG